VNDYPRVALHLELVPCDGQCGAYYVTLKDRAFSHWTCPACDIAAWDHYLSSDELTRRIPITQQEPNKHERE
jgi:hypothetical protein